jgi:hypothetical protein
MNAIQPTKISSADPARPCVLWLGPSSGAELALAHAWLAERTELVVSESPAAAAAACGPRRPALAILAIDRPGRWSVQDAVTISREWPLVPIVSVSSSLADGRRRSGPPLAGVEEVAWSDLPGRLDRWLVELAAGRPGPLGLPATARREERLLEANDSLQRTGRRTDAAPVSVAASRGSDLEGLVDLLTVAGRRVVRQIRGRPPLDEPAPMLVWDVGSLEEEDLAWLRMLAANRPALAILILESFPRGDSTQAAMRAGAGAVLGRPVSLEALVGTLERLESPLATGLGRDSGDR